MRKPIEAKELKQKEKYSRIESDIYRNEELSALLLLLLVLDFYPSSLTSQPKFNNLIIRTLKTIVFCRAFSIFARKNFAILESFSSRQKSISLKGFISYPYDFISSEKF